MDHTNRHKLTVLLSMVLAVSFMRGAFAADSLPAITSDATTVFTIGQACPKLIDGFNDVPIEVGTPCPFTVTASGSPTPTFTIGGVALPQGITFTDNLDGTGTLGGVPAAGTAGTYALTFTATNSVGPSVVQNFTLTINTPPQIVSSPFPTPNPATVGQTVSFNTAGFDADGNALTYTWNFGDGTLGNGASVTHTYTHSGNYMVNLILTDTANAFVYDTVNVVVTGDGTTIGNGGSGGGSENLSVVGAGGDSDGDGFSDAFEAAAGTDPINATSTPTGKSITASTLQPLTLTRAAIKLNFARTAGTDTIQFSGGVSIPAGFNPDGAKVYFDVGGVAKSFTLNAKGMAKDGSDAVKFAIKTKQGSVAAQNAQFTVAFTKGTFINQLGSATGLIDTTVKNSPVPVKFTVVIGGGVFQKSQALNYSAVFGKAGMAK